MANNHTTLTQTVILFPDEDTQAVQRVTVDKKDGWIILNHSGDEISLSLENWDKLKELAAKTIKKENARVNNASK
ncbi:hypothetical protein [Flavobacterium sp.]|uniref:hypothetical protein n=1 Tax=Flavobacterium sp. TaxID=239 RepID=UPI0022C5D29F|nr:hypothetical protein [Flavobacterium sp.]MCZ8144890.1 hypothetical protein [Flavobacterium sp.]